jgi:diguanylate cyclase (GGDEF)-like protein
VKTQAADQNVRDSECDKRVLELEAALKKAEVAKQIVAQTNQLLDRELFKSTVAKKVSDLACLVSDYDELARQLMELISKVADYDIATLILARGNSRRVATRLSRSMDRGAVEGFENRVLSAFIDEAGWLLRGAGFSRRLVGGGDQPADIAAGSLKSFSTALISIGDEAFGMIALGSAKESAFSKGELESFRLIAENATILIDDAARHEELRESRRKVERLHYTTQELESCQIEDEVYEVTISAAVEILSFRMCVVMIMEEGKLAIRARSSAWSPDATKQLDLGEAGVAARTLRTGRTIVFGNIKNVPDAVPTREDLECEIVSGISAPIGELGVFQANSPEQDAFTRDDVKLLELLLGHTVEAVRRIRLQERLRTQATRDPLTEAYNRRHFNEVIKDEMARSKRYGHDIGFLIIDVDRFKKINDVHGHQMGDLVLREVARFLTEQVRTTEMVVRYGGDEFLVVLPETGPTTEGVKDRIAGAVEEWNDSNELFDFQVGLSIGWSYWDHRDGMAVEEVLAEADRRMYEEKELRSENAR